MSKAKRHLKAVAKGRGQSRESLERDVPVKLPDDFGEAVRAVLPVQATRAAEGGTEGDAR